LAGLGTSSWSWDPASLGFSFGNSRSILASTKLNTRSLCRHLSRQWSCFRRRAWNGSSSHSSLSSRGYSHHPPNQHLDSSTEYLQLTTPPPPLPLPILIVPSSFRSTHLITQLTTNLLRHIDHLSFSSSNSSSIASLPPLQL
jgi:hypothetical protein